MPGNYFANSIMNRKGSLKAKAVKFMSIIRSSKNDWVIYGNKKVSQVLWLTPALLATEI